MERAVLIEEKRDKQERKRKRKRKRRCTYTQGYMERERIGQTRDELIQAQKPRKDEEVDKGKHEKIKWWKDSEVHLDEQKPIEIDSALQYINVLEEELLSRGQKKTLEEWHQHLDVGRAARVFTLRTFFAFSIEASY